MTSVVETLAEEAKASRKAIDVLVDAVSGFKGSFKVPDVRAFEHEAGWSAPGRSRRQPTGNKHFVTGDKG